MPKTVIFPFKRRETEFAGADVVRVGQGAEKWIPKQRVKIIGEHDADGDLWKVQTAEGVTFVTDGCELHPHPSAPELNTEFMVRCMEETGNGLMQAFIVEAVAKYAEMVLEMPEDQRAEMDKGMLPYAPWRDCAEAYLVALKERHGR